MLLTFIDYMPDGNYGALHQHPQIDLIHEHIQKHTSRSTSTILAGGILHMLKDTERLVFTSKYSPTLMGEFNAALCKHNPIFLYQLYEAVQTLCYGKSIARHAAINLSSIYSGKWSIVSAIESLVGRPLGASPEARSSEIGRKLMAKKRAEDNDPKGSMNLTDIMKRMPRLISAVSNHKPLVKEIRLAEQELGLSSRELQQLLPLYLDMSESARTRMARLLELLLEFGEDFNVLTTQTQIKSMQRMIDLCLNFTLRPAELDQSNDLMGLKL